LQVPHMTRGTRLYAWHSSSCRQPGDAAALAAWI